MNTVSQILEYGKTPAEWCKVFATKEIKMSQRNLRAKAREIGACYVFGKAMIITPEQIDQILEAASSSEQP